MTRLLVLAMAAVLLAPACGTCRKTKPPEPAGRRELELVDQALEGGGKYQAALVELEKDPTAGLRAVREQSAPAHSKKAVFLAMMADRLANVGRYHAWQETLDRSPGTDTRFRDLRQQLGSGAASDLQPIIGPAYPDRISGLDLPEQVHFWAERLLVLGGDSAHLAAVPHLERLGSAAAIDALALYTRTPSSSIAMSDAGRALGRLGRGRELADALAAYQNPPIPPTAIPGGVATIKAGFATLPPAARTRSENDLLTALEKEPLSDDQRAGYVAALGEIGTARAVDRLAALRRTPWGEQHKMELDLATAAILDREEP